MRRWLKADQAPRAALLALFWETRWGRSAIDADRENLVRTTMGHLVLDNLRPDIVPMFRTGYRWLAMQSATNSAYWVDFHLGPTQVAVAPPRLRLTFENTPVAEVFELRGMISAMN